MLASTPSRSSGKERDTETGLDYFGARYYRGIPWSRADREVRTAPPYTHNHPNELRSPGTPIARGRIGHTQFISSALSAEIHSTSKGCATCHSNAADSSAAVQANAVGGLVSGAPFFFLRIFSFVTLREAGEIKRGFYPSRSPSHAPGWKRTRTGLHT
jgi:hypothetical protein